MKLIEINTPGHLDAFRSDDIISDYIQEGRIYSRNELWYFNETDEEVKDYLENAFYPYLGIQDQAEKEFDESSWKSLNEEFKFEPRNLNNRFSKVSLEKIPSLYLENESIQNKLHDICSDFSQDKISVFQHDFINFLKRIKKEEEFRENKKVQIEFITKIYQMIISTLEYHEQMYIDELREFFVDL